MPYGEITGEEKPRSNECALGKVFVLRCVTGRKCGPGKEKRQSEKCAPECGGDGPRLAHAHEHTTRAERERAGEERNERRDAAPPAYAITFQ